MSHVRIVTNIKGTVLRHIDMTGHSSAAVDKVTNVVESIICEERDYVHIDVNYDGCDDSKTIEGVC